MDYSSVDAKNEKQWIQSKQVGRTGCLAFWDTKSSLLVLFAGQNVGIHETSKQRLMMNDVLLYDTQAMQIADQLFFPQSLVRQRIYPVGFKIEDTIYSIGGVNNIEVLSEFIEINIKSKQAQRCVVDKGLSLLKKQYCSAITGVFYQARLRGDGQFTVANLTSDINWGAASELI